MTRTLVAVIITSLQLMADQTMPKPGCNIFKVAEDYIAQRFPFIDLRDRHPTASESHDVWKVRYDLPEGTLGFVPIVSINKATCKVVHAEVEQ